MMNRKNSTPKLKAARQPVQNRSIQTREKIIDTGEKLFIQKGFHEVLADDIAREAGVSVGSFYSYFDDKRALFLVILDRESMQMMTGIEKNLSILSGSDASHIEEILRKTLEVLVEAHRRYFPLFLQAQQMAAFDDEVNRFQVESDRVTMQTFEKILLNLRPSLRNENLQAVSYVIYFASEGIIHNLVTSLLTEAEEREILNESTHLLISYIQRYLAH